MAGPASIRRTQAATDSSLTISARRCRRPRNVGHRKVLSNRSRERRAHRESSQRARLWVPDTCPEKPAALTPRPAPLPRSHVRLDLVFGESRRYLLLDCRAALPHPRARKCENQTAAAPRISEPGFHCVPQNIPQSAFTDGSPCVIAR